MYIFGYGSLIWKPGFPYEKQTVGFIKGFARRFWQGSEDHRGQPGSPGRVVVVVPSEQPNEQVWGVAFKVSKENEASVLHYLINRESGYVINSTDFYPRDRKLPIVECSFFIATKDSPCYLGPAAEEEIAQTIYYSKGKSGGNLEYFLQFIAVLKELMPDEIESDKHVGELERQVRRLAAVNQLDIDQLLVDAHHTVSASRAQAAHMPTPQQEQKEEEQ